MPHWQTFHLCCYQELSPQPPTLWTATTGGRSNSELDWEKESQEPQHFKRIVLQDAVIMKDKEHTINILVSPDRHQEAPCFDFAASAIQVHHNFFFSFYSIFATISSWSHSAIPFVIVSCCLLLVLHLCSRYFWIFHLLSFHHMAREVCHFLILLTRGVFRASFNTDCYHFLSIREMQINLFKYHMAVAPSFFCSCFENIKSSQWVTSLWQDGFVKLPDLRYVLLCKDCFHILEADFCLR